ncbi:MAG TPA: hypothetical protein VL418_08195, partial [Devosiaceae bacterium]|nr:hypothetical protein [Devosiaceae bacterium]
MSQAPDPIEEAIAATAALWDWRRRVQDLFHQIRASSDPAAAWRLWRDTRAELFAHHPQTPLDPGGEMPEYFDYDPGLR